MTHERRRTRSQNNYEQWREESKARIAEGIREQLEADGYSISAGDYFSALKDSLGLMDIVFMLLGTVTAFKIGCGRER